MMILTIKTTQENQVVNLGYNLGRWENTDTAASAIKHGGVINWGDNSEEYEFDGTEGIVEENNGLVHTYETVGEYKIIISGIVRWNRVSNMYTNTSTPTSIRATLKSIEIPKGKTSPIYYIDQYAFYCSELLESIPGNLFENCKEVTKFLYCFGRCKLGTIPEKLFENCTQATNFYYCFDNCSQLIKISPGIFDSCTKAQNFTNCFAYTNIEVIPEGLFDHCTHASTFSRCFERCGRLASIPKDLFAKNRNSSIFSHTFYVCTSVTGDLPPLWTTHRNASHYACFFNCTKATNFQEAKAAGWA